MLLLLIAVPVIVVVACAHSMLQAYAPSNVLVRRVRASRPSLGMAAALGAVALGCASAVQAIRVAIEAGAPGWLNLLVLVLAWDAIKFVVMACVTSMRRIASVVSRTPRLASSADLRAAFESSASDHVQRGFCP